MLDKRPYQGLSKRCWLQELCNHYGDFKVAIAYIKDGELRWSKHRGVLECWHNDLSFLDKVNNRGAMPTEIRTDIDPTDNETPAELKARFDRVCERIESKGGPTSYSGWFSGSRGYHIHMCFPKLASVSYSQKNLIKEAIINICEGEALKVSDHSMLTMEWAPNNKTGNLKIPIRGDFNWLP